MHAILMRWLPASGKSTRAKELETKWYARFSRDDIREPRYTEKEIERKEKDFMDMKLDRIVIDNTHMGKSLQSKITYLESLWYKCTVYDMSESFDSIATYYSECTYRNYIREKRVPQSVIDRMYLSEYGCCPDSIIVDLDGTLCNINHRLHHVEKEPKDWESFFKEIPNDTVNQWVKELIDMLWDRDIILLSWRPDSYYDTTAKWLADNSINYNFILMRSHWDRRPDYQVKRDLYNQCLDWNIALAIDDRDEVCQLRKEKNIPYLQLKFT